MYLVNRPVPFSGTQAERNANVKTHNWRQFGESEVECVDCAARPWHVAATYPCGVEPPREMTEVREPGDPEPTCKEMWKA